MHRLLHQTELQEVVDRARGLKSEKCYARISEIVMKADKPSLNKKGNEVNAHLNAMSKEKNIFLIDLGKKIKENHLNSCLFYFVYSLF